MRRPAVDAEAGFLDRRSIETPPRFCLPRHRCTGGSTPPPGGGSEPPKLGKLVGNPKTGTATLAIQLPGPGKLVISGKGVTHVTKSVKGAGKVTVTIRATGKQMKKLKEDDTVTLTVTVAFTPTGGKTEKVKKAVVLKLAP
jgi:hypothetical protein